MTKKCKICGLIDDENSFVKGRRKCIDCHKQYQKQWRNENKNDVKKYREDNAEKISLLKKKHYEENVEYYKNKNKKWYEENKEYKLEKRKEYYRQNKKRCSIKAKLYREENKETIKVNREKNKEYYTQYHKKYSNRRSIIRKSRYKKDFDYKISQLIRGSFKRAFKIYSNGGKTKALKEYGIDIKAIVEHLGQPPQDGKSYHIDHIFPVSAFDLTNPEHIRLCWHPDNLRWLEGKENMSKGNKYDEVLFEDYLIVHRKNQFMQLSQEFDKVMKDNSKIIDTTRLKQIGDK